MFDLINYLTIEKEKGTIIWLCNIGAEKYWNKINGGIVDKQEDIIVSHIEEMNLLLCRKQDIIILREKPDEEYLKTLVEFGFEVPEILVTENDSSTNSISELVLKDEKILERLKGISAKTNEVFFVPYAVTCVEEEIAEKCGLKLIGSPSKINAKINDKILGRIIAKELDFSICDGKVCNSIEEIRDEYYRLTEAKSNFAKVIIKEPFGASGKGLYVIDDESKLEGNLRLISRLARNNVQAKWLVEGWYNKEIDINYQIYISLDGEVKVFSIKEQVLKDTVYIGSKIPARISDEVILKYNEYGEKIGKYLFNLGFTGVAGVDSFITNEDNVIPIIEINGRFTLSTYISFLQNVCGENKISTRYFKVLTKIKYDYKAIKELLSESNILFDPNRKEGVIVYTSATLPNRLIDNKNSYFGRIFALIVAKDELKLAIYTEKLENIIKKLL